MPAERGLRLPSLAEHPPVPAPLGLLAEPFDHLPPVPGLGPLAPVPPAVQRDHGGPHPEVFAAVPVVVLAVERGVGEHPVPGDAQGRLSHDRTQLRGVVGRPGGDRGPGEEVALGIARDGELGPQPGRVLPSGSFEEVARGVPALQTGAIDGCGWGSGDQTAIPCERSGAQKEDDVGPPFSSRCSA